METMVATKKSAKTASIWIEASIGGSPNKSGSKKVAYNCVNLFSETVHHLFSSCQVFRAILLSIWGIRSHELDIKCGADTIHLCVKVLNSMENGYHYVLHFLVVADDVWKTRNIDDANSIKFMFRIYSVILLNLLILTTCKEFNLLQ